MCIQRIRRHVYTKISPTCVYKDFTDMCIQRLHRHVYTTTSPTCVYKEFVDFKKHVAKLSLGNIWKVKVTENLVYASFQSTNHILPKFEVFVDERLYFSVRVYGCMLPDNQGIYSMYSRSFMNMTFSHVTLSLGQLHSCNGI